MGYYNDPREFPQPTRLFSVKKATILDGLSRPDSQYTDASPKGSVDEGIRDLIDQINAQEGLVTTSSCAGRVSVYLEGKKSKLVLEQAQAQAGAQIEGLEDDNNNNDDAAAAAAGDDATQAATRGRRRGKGRVTASTAGGKGGGEWLYVSHDPIEYPHPHPGGGGYEEWFGLLGGAGAGATTAEQKQGELGSEHELDDGSRLIHFKFEPMILHILTNSPLHAQLVIQAGMEAGFRETGAVSLINSRQDDNNDNGKKNATATPMVAVRSMGLCFESLIGSQDEQGRRTCLVTHNYLATLVRIANERFAENSKRIARFQAALKSAFTPKPRGYYWEDPDDRRERKRQEGLELRKNLMEQSRKQSKQTQVDETEDLDLDLDLDPVLDIGGLMLQEPDGL